MPQQEPECDAHAIEEESRRDVTQNADPDTGQVADADGDPAEGEEPAPEPPQEPAD
jgi:hypothetical protein